MSIKREKMFFWFGVFVFDSKKIEYGGFNHFVAGKIFGWRFNYLIISLRMQFRFSLIHEQDACYYDGYHNCLNIGFLQISYGT